MELSRAVENLQTAAGTFNSKAAELQVGPAEFHNRHDIGPLIRAYHPSHLGGRKCSFPANSRVLFDGCVWQLIPLSARNSNGIEYEMVVHKNAISETADTQVPQHM